MKQQLEQQHGQVDWGQQGVLMPGSPEAWSQGSGPPRERKKDRKRESILIFTQDTGLDRRSTPDITNCP